MFRKRTPLIEARQILEGAEWVSLFHWIEENTYGTFDLMGHVPPLSGVVVDPESGEIVIANSHGLQPTQRGNWVLYNARNGDFTVMSDEAFHIEYEAAQ